MPAPFHGIPGMIVTAEDSGRIAIRNVRARGWPSWLWPSMLFLAMYLLLGAFYWLISRPYLEGWGWFWIAYAGLFLLAGWSGSIVTFEVGPAQLVVRRHLRSQKAQMADVLRVDAKKMPWGFAARFRAAPYSIDVWLTGYRHWRLQNVEPEAGDRLLAALHGYQKPIWVVRTA